MAPETRGVSRSVKAFSLCVAVVTIAALAAAVEPARACSCIQPDPWRVLEQADAAFVGRLVSRQESGDGRATLVFSVERAVKGKVGDTVEVETASSGAACGIETSVGRRIGLFLVREGDGWFGHLCWQVEPEDLLAAASLPAPNGRGSVAMFVGGRFEPARTLALDAKGRTLAYGMGDGVASLLSPCPGGQRLAEIAFLDLGEELAIRDARNLRTIRRQVLRLPGGRYPVGLLCEDRDGSSVVIFASGPSAAGLRSAIYRLTGKRLTALWKGTAFLSSLTPPIAYLTSFDTSWQGCEGWPSCYRLVAVDLRTGRATRVASLRWSAYLLPDESRRYLAGVAYPIGARSRVVLVDLAAQPAKVLSSPLAARDVGVGIFWLPDRRFLFLALGHSRVLDLKLRTRSRFRWRAVSGALVGSTVFGVHYKGNLVSAKLPSGPMRVIRRLSGTPILVVPATG